MLFADAHITLPKSKNDPQYSINYTHDIAAEFSTEINSDKTENYDF
jgi:hypothetical protein